MLPYTGSDGAPLKYGKLSDKYRPDSGKALLFIPGLGGSVKGALNFLSQLSREYSPIYGPDLRGFGLNPIETPLSKADIILRDLEAFYQQIIAPTQHPHVALCGISLGGVLSTLMTAKNPERYSSLTLLAPAFKPHPQSFSLGYVLKNVMGHLILGSKARTTLPYGMEAVTGNPAILNDPQFNKALNLTLTPGFLLNVRDFCNQAMREVATIQNPTLMVIPGEDVVCDPMAMRQAFNRLPGNTPKQLLEYPEFFHDVLFEHDQPRLTQDILGGLLSLDSCSTSFSSR